MTDKVTIAFDDGEMASEEDNEIVRLGLANGMQALIDTFGERKAPPWCAFVTVAMISANMLAWLAQDAASLERLLKYHGEMVAKAARSKLRSKPDGEEGRAMQ